MKHLQPTKPHVVYTRFRKTDDVFVPRVPVVMLPVAEVFTETSKRSVAAALVICLMFSSLFVSAGKQLGTLSYFSDTESTLANNMRAGEWGEPEVLVEIQAFSLLLSEEDEGLVAGVEDAQPEETVPEETPAPEEVVVEEEQTTEETPAIEEVPAPEPAPEEVPAPEVVPDVPAETPALPTPEPDPVPEPAPQPEPTPEPAPVVETPPVVES